MSGAEHTEPMFEMDMNEVRLLSAAFIGLPRDEVAGDVVWLQVEEKQRIWVVQSDLGSFELTVPAEHHFSTDGWIPVSDRVVRFSQACEALDSETVSVGLAHAEGVRSAIVVSSGDMSAVIDIPEVSVMGPDELTWEVSAYVSVGAKPFCEVLDAARSMPSGANRLEWLSPPMWLGLADGNVGLHIDWSDVLPSRSTYRLEGLRSSGEATVSMAHAIVGPILSSMFFEHERLNISVGTVNNDGDERDAIIIGGPGWSLVTYTVNALLDRWERKVSTMLKIDEFKVLHHHDTEWLVGAMGNEVRISLHFGHPDVARVSAVVVSEVEETIELMREINALNVANSGVRLFFVEGEVRVAADVRLSEFDALSPTITEVASQAGRYGDLMRVFGTTADLDS